MTSVSGTEGYADEADDLFPRYENISSAEIHRSVLHLIPTAPCGVLDIGSGTGRDAAALAAMGTASSPSSRRPKCGREPRPFTHPDKSNGWTTAFRT